MVDLSNLGEGVDSESVLALAGVILKIAVPQAGVVITSLEAALPVALRIYKMVKSENFSPEELEVLNKIMNEQSAAIQAPLDDPPPAA